MEPGSKHGSRGSWGGVVRGGPSSDNATTGSGDGLSVGQTPRGPECYKQKQERGAQILRSEGVCGEVRGWEMSGVTELHISK